MIVMYVRESNGKEHESSYKRHKSVLLIRVNQWLIA